MLTFKRKLKLTKEQAERIDSWIGACRCVYNLALEIRKECWKNEQRTIHKYELSKQIKDLRAEQPFFATVPFVALEDSVFRMDRAYESFFKGKGFPNWARKGRYLSISLKQVDDTVRCVDANRLRIPVLGTVKMAKDAEIYGKIKKVTIKKDCNGYYAFIVTDAIKNIQCKDENQVVALDMGIARLYTDSNGHYCENPRHYKKYERRLRIANRSLARKKRGSNSWKHQKHQLAKLHHKIANVRRDFLHKESTKIAKANHTVILEDLNVAGMKRSALSKSISDAGWGLFREMLSYKTTVIAINPRYTSQTCNDCGAKDKKSRISQSKFVCTNCGSESNADENAAKNILGLGTAFIRQRGALARA